MIGNLPLALLLIGAGTFCSPQSLLAEELRDQCQHAIQLVQKGKLQRAQGELDSLLQIERKDQNDRVILGWTLSTLGEEWAKAGERTLAVADLRKALQLDPDEAYWHSILAELLHAQGNGEDAAKECSQAAQLSPDDSGLADGCGFGTIREIWDDDTYLALRAATKPDKTIHTPEGDVTPPAPKKPRPDPDYTEKARRAKLEGFIVLWLVLGVNGNVEKAAVKKSIGLGLDQNALRTIRQWRFTPATRNGVPIPYRVEVELSFRFL